MPFIEEYPLTEVSGQPINISGQVINISGQPVKISGETVIAQVSGNLTASISGQPVVIASGQVDILNMPSITTDISGQPVKISGETVITAISGETVIAKISGETVKADASVSGSVTVISGQVDILNMPPVTTDISGQPVTVSGDIVRAEQYGAWGVQVSGAVIVSGDLAANISGQPVWVASGNVNASQTGTWGVQVSGAVQVSGEVTAYISGQPVDITIPADIIINAGANPLAVASLSGGTILTSADCISVTVKALSENSGDIYVGGYTTGNMPYSGAGLLLAPGEAVNIDIDNTGKVHVFAVVSGDKVTYIANK